MTGTTLFAPPPLTAAWRHLDARTGFEVAYFHPLPGGHRVEGCTTAVEDGHTWIVEYRIDLTPAWATRTAHVTCRTSTGTRHTILESDGEGRWRVNGEHAPHLDGCLDVDLESSAMTNTFPVHRLTLPVGAEVQAPAAYVRALDLTVERLEQQYVRTADPGRRYDYFSPAFGFACRLTYDESGLVLDYPGIAVRAI
ncbi:putative glycolipid-binding domain-containing protein [Sphaerisporangium aureirubrum]|uniref:Glycolipid-binding domain-containing protein n=1 Tax=Sphaerisporangium aureirubrum TaxID=1544736 RepID=A0ABW1NHU8_9ACTN